MRLALFDFDGTITTRDSLFDFLLFTFGAARCAAGLIVLGPVLVLYVLKKIPNCKAKEAVFRHFFKGWSIERFEKVGERYSRERLDHIIMGQARERIEWHRTGGHRIIVVSASVETWMREWCGRYGIGIIATRLESAQGKLTGRIDGANCQGPEKVRRIREAVNLDEYEYIYAYGNTRGDADMLSLAHEQYYNWVKVAG
ncbi:MAG: HAD-IB family hydrolase [Spirochaetes bacterium]|nr:HAD-IB family hydrolase [Spirochaetota bacterium]